MYASNLILACRSLEKGEAAKSEILSETGCESRTRIEVWEVDLDRFDSVKAFCKRVHTELDRVDGFIANAGVESETYEESEGLERTLTINVVLTFFMVISTLPKLQEVASKHGVDTRLSIVGSLIHYMAPDSQLDVPSVEKILMVLSNPTTADMASCYPLSKLVVHQVFDRLMEKLPIESASKYAIVNLVSPGWCSTELGRNKNRALFERVCFRMMGRTSEEGSRSLVHAVTAGRETHKKYLSECKVAPQSAYMRSERGRCVGERLFGETIQRIRDIDAKIAQCIE